MRRLRIWAAFAAWGVLAPAQAEARNLAEVTECMRANVPTAVRVQRFDLVAYDRAERPRAMQGRLFASRERELIRVNLRLDAPADMRDTTYLLRETEDGRDDLFVFLPALNRVRRVTGTSGDNALFGTDFSYNDLRQIHNAFSGDEVRLLPPVTVDGVPLDHLEILRTPDASSPHSRILVWVDPQSCVALKTEFYEGERLSKRMTSPRASLTRVEGHWYAAATDMRDLINGTRSELRITGVAASEALPERLFNPRLFYLGN